MLKINSADSVPLPLISSVTNKERKDEMPEYNNRFAAPKYIEETILDKDEKKSDQ